MLTQQQLSEVIKYSARIRFFLNLNRKLKPFEYFEKMNCEEALEKLKIELPFKEDFKGVSNAKS